MEKFFPLIKAETSLLDELKKKASKVAAAQANGEDEEEEEDEGKLFEPDYLQKMLKLVRSGKELNFGFGLNAKDPAASKLVLARKGKPDKLFKALKQTGEFSNRLIAFGTAVPDAQDGKTLIFWSDKGADENWSFYTVGLDGTALTELTPGAKMQRDEAMLADGAPRPAAIIGCPVGFIGAAESKDALAGFADEHGIDVPFVTVRGRRGGSAMASSAVNALAQEAE